MPKWWGLPRIGAPAQNLWLVSKQIAVAELIEAGTYRLKEWKELKDHAEVVGED
jgi:hypothetical protein